MGIRFFCPNGHKLNVKSFLAGKRGFCPHCGTSLRVPVESTRPSSRGSEGGPPRGAPEAPSPAPGLGERFDHFPPLEQENEHDPNAVWYIRPPSGGQYGPATSTVMRTWIDENRVSPDTLVWRDGWRDWQEAAAVFPQLGDSVEPLDDPGFIGPAFAQDTDTRWENGAAPPAREKVGSNTRITLIVVLALVIVVLAALLVWGVFGSGAAPAH